MGVLLNRRRYMGEVLPYDAEIEYLESDGNQYINTEINCNSQYILEVEVQGTTSTEGILGARISMSSSMHTLVFPGGSQANQIRYSCGASASNIYVNIDFQKFNLYKGNYNKLYINGTLAGTSSNSTIFTLNFPYYLFALNINGSVSNLGPKKIKMCKIWNGESLLLDLIPVRIGQTGYMFDKVSKKLLSNQGTGNFILGPDKVLPDGYVRLEELSVTSGNQHVFLDIEKGGSNITYKTEISIKWSTVDSTKRQLFGFERDPWFGCDKGVFKGSGIINSVPAIDTQMVADTWYDIIFEGKTSSNGYNTQKFTLFSLDNYLQYQSYGAIKDNFNVYKNGELIGNFITCIDPSNVTGVFNTVTKTFCPLINY